MHEIPEAPPADCFEFPFMMSSLVDMSNMLLEMIDEQYMECLAVVDSMRSFVSSARPSTRHYFAPIWAALGFCSLRLEAYDVARSDLNQGLASLDSLERDVEQFLLLYEVVGGDDQGDSTGNGLKSDVELSSSQSSGPPKNRDDLKRPTRTLLINKKGRRSKSKALYLSTKPS